MDERSPASRTAILVAALRGRAAARAAPLCVDPWAAQLAGAEGEALADELLAHYPPAELWIGLRTTWIDARVAQLTVGERACEQAVLLGAGFDTRAARLARPGLRWFEVDHPNTGEERARRLGSLEGYPEATATTVACDFERDDFLERLVSGGFDPAKPAVFLWEGVVPYLTEPSVLATLERLADGCHPRSVILFDHLGKRLARGGQVDSSDEGMRDLVGGLGEPFRFGLDDPIPLLHTAGFRQVRTVSFDEICLAQTGTYDRSRKLRFQYLTAASVARPLAV